MDPDRMTFLFSGDKLFLCLLKRIKFNLKELMSNG